MKTKFIFPGIEGTGDDIDDKQPKRYEVVTRVYFRTTAINESDAIRQLEMIMEDINDRTPGKQFISAMTTIPEHTSVEKLDF